MLISANVNTLQYAQSISIPCQTHASSTTLLTCVKLASFNVAMLYYRNLNCVWKWVASYRRDQSYSGRISYSNMYSALNAIAGHYNSFGTSYPIPKKRLDRILQECDVAEKALARGR